MITQHTWVTRNVLKGLEPQLPCTGGSKGQGMIKTPPRTKNRVVDGVRVETFYTVLTFLTSYQISINYRLSTVHSDKGSF